MRPALQRLLARPSSLELLQCLVGTSHDSCSLGVKTPIRSFSRDCGHNQAASTTPHYYVATKYSENEPTAWEQPLPLPSVNELIRRTQDAESQQISSGARYHALDFGSWKEGLWTREELEFESNLDHEGQKLLDQPIHKVDIRLWACLFAYRQRLHGDIGVRMFWNAAKRGDFQIPVEGPYAALFWEGFVRLGLQDQDILDEIAEQTNGALEPTTKQWPGLYTMIIKHMLLNGRGQEAIEWHHRIFDSQSLSPDMFAKMACQVILREADVDALKRIYEMNSHRNIYGMVIPYLCEKEDFRSAYNWHFILMDNGDFPANSNITEPLVHFLAVYYRGMAVEVTKSLVEAGIPFASSVTSSSEESTKLSREMMNLMHGEIYNIPAMNYNDSIGARWFATRWVSLDVAITATSALGVNQIGPLSLQAIAHREKDADAIAQRIDQLRGLGINIGNSTFSRSVERFARSGNQEFLDNLLQSDQHPDAMEDSAFLEELLSTYASARDWPRYRMTMAMRLVHSKNHDVESKNILLRNYAMRGDIPALLATLQKMHATGDMVTTISLKTILKSVLRPRQRSRRPVVAHVRKGDDLKMAIDILRRVLQSGCFVPATYWREIVKRLGMVGRWKDLEDLCIFLASWYGPARTDSVLDSTKQRRLHRYQVPAQVKTNHPLHPLKLLFPVLLQQSIVEWGFMHALRPRDKPTRRTGLIMKSNSSPSVASGIDLLKRLHAYHVHINIQRVRKAILDRLIIYYGPGKSNKIYNRRAREHNVLTLEEVAAQIDEALGMEMFNTPDLRQTIEQMGRSRIDRKERIQAQLPKPPDSRGLAESQAW